MWSVLYPSTASSVGGLTDLGLFTAPTTTRLNSSMPLWPRQALHSMTSISASVTFPSHAVPQPPSPPLPHRQLHYHDR